MKANELMVGDYIMLYEDIYIIEEISSKGWAHIIHNDGSKCRVPLSTDYILGELTPVPLTAEILEKNFNTEKIDFEGRIVETLYTDHNEFYKITISKYIDELWEVEIDEIEFSSPTIWKMYVCNVHELQHALRLRGINKEIKI